MDLHHGVHSTQTGLGVSTGHRTGVPAPDVPTCFWLFHPSTSHPPTNPSPALSGSVPRTDALLPDLARCLDNQLWVASESSIVLVKNCYHRPLVRAPRRDQCLRVGGGGPWNQNSYRTKALAYRSQAYLTPRISEMRGNRDIV